MCGVNSVVTQVYRHASDVSWHALLLSGIPDALNGGAKEGKGKGTSQPGHGAAIGLIVLCCNHRSQLLIADGGCISCC